MAFKFSLGGAKANKAQLNSKAKEEEEAKAREEKNALDKVMADFEAEHGAEKSVLGELERDQDAEHVFVPTGSKRHFTGRQRTMKSGPGTLDAEPLDGYSRPGGGPGTLPPQMQSRFGGAVPTGPAALEGPKPTENVFTTVVAKASNLPPTIDPRQVEELFADFPTLKITRVERVPPQGPLPKGRPSATMKVIFDKDANARDLDDAMNKLNDKKYLGKGYYLHLDRYLGGRSADTAQRTEPFGARWQAPEIPKGFAPPPDLGGGGGGGRDRPREDTEQLIVTANQPPDVATLRLVHQTIEGVILGGVEFEAALMNDSQIQDEERFAWLYDQKHPVNRYYRWRLHQIVCDSPNPEIFARQGDWRGPVDPLADEFADHLGAFDSEDEILDSDDDDEKEKPLYKPLPVGDNYPGRVDNGHGIMSPRSRAMFLWLLTSLPPGSIVADDIAAISNFAVEHAGQGMDEVIHILVSNIIQPFQLTDTNPRNRPTDVDGKDDLRRPDARQVTLNALRIISDVLLVTAKESGVSYKYRLAIGTELVQRKVFEHLEQLPAQLEMGRMTERSYRDEVNVILKVWQDEHLFEESTLRHLDEAFNARERQKEEEDQARKLAERRKKKATVVRKTVSTGTDENGEEKVEVEEELRDGAAEGEADQTPETATPEVPLTDEAVADEIAEGTSAQPDSTEAPKRASSPDIIPGETAVARARRLRPRAEDMFALDEDE
ncbi:coatamer subunit protein [Stemphylium lycopersici]|nr:coatamer subunit protein [Stemphylium lycopersici]